MFGQTGKILAISNAIAAFRNAFTQTSSSESLLKAASFSCEPHTRTYIVKPLDQRGGKAIRCVKFSEKHPGNSSIPKFACYGERNRNRATYRHVAYPFYSGSNLIGYASDLYGNGENINNNFPGNLKIQIVGNG